MALRARKVPGPFEKRAPFTVVKMGQRRSMNIFPGHSYHNVYLYCIYHVITKANAQGFFEKLPAPRGGNQRCKLCRS